VNRNMPMELVLRAGEQEIGRGRAAVIVPEAALDQPDLIRTLTVAGIDAAKHSLHALCQIAVVEEEEGSLDALSVPRDEALQVDNAGETIVMPCGSVLLLGTDGSVRVACHEGLRRDRLVKAAHRFCTRFIRLDLR